MAVRGCYGTHHGYDVFAFHASKAWDLEAAIRTKQSPGKSPLSVKSVNTRAYAAAVFLAAASTARSVTTREVRIPWTWIAHGALSPALEGKNHAGAASPCLSGTVTSRHTSPRSSGDPAQCPVHWASKSVMGRAAVVFSTCRVTDLSSSAITCPTRAWLVKSSPNQIPYDIEAADRSRRLRS